MLKADFNSVRGGFKFGTNQHPIQDWYSTEVVKDAGGKLVIKTTGKIMSNLVDAYAKDCKF
jgi:branched-chain amino acid transport system substrate-binding protein